MKYEVQVSYLKWKQGDIITDNDLLNAAKVDLLKINWIRPVSERIELSGPYATETGKWGFYTAAYRYLPEAKKMREKMEAALNGETFTEAEIKAAFHTCLTDNERSSMSAYDLIAQLKKQK